MKKKSALPWLIGIGISIVLLFALMLAVVMMTGVTSGTLYGSAPFSLSSLTSGETNTASVGNSVLPSFIGIVTEGKKQGIAAGDSVIEEIYTTLAPWIADALAAEPYTVTNGPDMQEQMLVIEYHTALPGTYIAACAAASAGTDASEAYTRAELFSSIRRLFLQITPGGKYTVLLESTDGGWLRYTCTAEMGEAYPTVQKWAEWQESFRSHFYRFAFAAELAHTEEVAGDNVYDDPYEIVFLERMRTRGMIIGDEMGTMLRNRQDHTDSFARLLGYNPDKLASREEKDGGLTLVENHGILRLGADSFQYTANADGGLELSHIIGYSDSYTSLDLLRGAWTVIETLRSLQPYCAGADAGITLTDVFKSTDGIRLTFSYTFDNLLLENCPHAAVFVFSEDFRLVSMEIAAIAVRSIGEYSVVYAENGIRPMLGYGNTILVYEADFSAQSIFPQWARVVTEVHG